jgi:hypothetical protein
MPIDLKKFDYAVKSENILSKNEAKKNKVGRKSLEEDIKLTKNLRIALNRKDFELINGMARRNGLNLSGFARMILKNYMDDNGV